MKITMKYKLNIVFSLLCLVSTLIFAQHKQNKLSKKISTNKDVTVSLNTSHTNIIFETWNKNTVEVVAYLEGDHLTPENSERLLENWHVETYGDDRQITINSTTGVSRSRAISASGINDGLHELRMLGPMITNMLEPFIENAANNPMPSALTENVANISFDYGKYRKDEEKYIKQWERQIQEKFGDDFQNNMEAWARELERNAKKSGNQVEVRMETWGNRFGEDMNAWGEQFGKQMEAWASQFTRGVENVNGRNTNVITYRYTTDSKVNTVNKIIKIRMPKAANLKLNIRHGEVKLAERSNNVKASLSHTRLNANIIDGDQTYIQVSYSPVTISQWNNGRLVINYVKNCRIENAKNLRVNADSSNIFIQELDKNGAISGSFGAITIASLGESFSTLDLALENSDFKLKLPKTAFNFAYSGAQSSIALPKTLDTNTRRNFGNVFVNGFQKTRNTNKAITINAKYSEIILQ